MNIAGTNTTTNKTTIAVCVLFFEKADQTIQCLESFCPSGVPIYVLNQNSSEEATRRLVSYCEKKEQINLFHSNRNLGASGGRNYLIQITQEEWLFFVDNDITIRPNDWLQTFLFYANRIQADVFIPWLFNKHDGRFAGFYNLSINGDKMYLHKPAGRMVNFFPGGASIINRRLFRELGLYEEKILSGYEDYEYCIRALKKQRLLKAFIVDEIELIHDHRFSPDAHDQKAEKERYKLDHIQKSVDVIFQKHGIRIRENWKEWCEEQVKKITDKNYVEENRPQKKNEQTFRLNLKQLFRHEWLKKEFEDFENRLTKQQSIDDLANQHPLTKGEKIRILYLIPWMPIGGAELVDYYILKGLPKEQFHVTLIVENTTQFEWRQKFEERADEIFFLPEFPNVFRPRLLEYLVISRAIQMVVFRGTTGYEFTKYSKKTGYSGLVFADILHAHNYGADYISSSLSYHKYLDRRYVISQNLATYIQNTYDLKAEKLKVIYNGLDFDFWDRKKSTPVLRKELELDSHRFVVGFIGRLSWEKQPQKFVEIAACFLSDPDPPLFVMIGDGKLEDDLRQMIEEKEVETLVKLLGARENVRDLLADVDLLVITSLQEGTPYVMLEAMAMGVPVLTPDLGGIKELLTENGGFILPEDAGVADFAEKTRLIREHYDLFWEKREQNRETLAQKVALPIMQASYRNDFQQLIQQHFDEEQRLRQIKKRPQINHSKITKDATFLDYEHHHIIQNAVRPYQERIKKLQASIQRLEKEKSILEEKISQVLQEKESIENSFKHAKEAWAEQKKLLEEDLTKLNRIKELEREEHNAQIKAIEEVQNQKARAYNARLDSLKEAGKKERKEFEKAKQEIFSSFSWKIGRMFTRPIAFLFDLLKKRH
jgi:glycosyltransferase involved in cell wall biosynthesis/GT2 family glycosyltransferase